MLQSRLQRLTEALLALVQNRSLLLFFVFRARSQAVHDGQVGREEEVRPVVVGRLRQPQ